ncbi:semialdehyde dehydrogenase [Halobacteria archaeon AArc-m2/3/4]|uniref:Semialdehyde dehydrogenase n=1 Tax=Natronoglomus mannanivorans TaxID=2979990 RepID=A0ABT2QKM4_9EURY|nr:semialdehyde dehydrogenase [Halobacteria archaeon AArc-m2/3/4]
MSRSIALFGAGGKMGCRITDQLKDNPHYDVRYVEPSEDGADRLADRSVSPTPVADAVDGANVAIMAVPDRLLGSVLEDVAPRLDPGSIVMLLDPAAAYAGVLPEVDDLSYVISHPCHPPLFDGPTDSEERRDWFGGQGLAEQDIVCALHRGSEEDYAIGEAIARDIYAPVDEAHRVTTEQMAILEPQLVEALLSTCLIALEEGMQRVIEMGVPEAAARSMMYGHLRTELAIVFDEVDFPLSDGAQRVAAESRDELFRSEWKETFFGSEKVRRNAELIVEEN